MKARNEIQKRNWPSVEQLCYLVCAVQPIHSVPSRVTLQFVHLMRICLVLFMLISPGIPSIFSHLSFSMSLHRKVNNDFSYLLACITTSYIIRCPCFLLWSHFSCFFSCLVRTPVAELLHSWMWVVQECWFFFYFYFFLAQRIERWRSDRVSEDLWFHHSPQNESGVLWRAKKLLCVSWPSMMTPCRQGIIVLVKSHKDGYWKQCQ